jgi:hypothetical protein
MWALRLGKCGGLCAFALDALNFWSRSARVEADTYFVPVDRYGDVVVHLGIRAGERAASIYTPVATAKLNGLNPETYLRVVPGQDRRRTHHQSHRRTGAMAADPDCQQRAARFVLEALAPAGDLLLQNPGGETHGCSTHLPSSALHKPLMAL